MAFAPAIDAARPPTSAIALVVADERAVTAFKRPQCISKGPYGYLIAMIALVASEFDSGGSSMARTQGADRSSWRLYDSRPQLRGAGCKRIIMKRRPDGPGASVSLPSVRRPSRRRTGSQIPPIMLTCRPFRAIGVVRFPLFLVIEIWVGATVVEGVLIQRARDQGRDRLQYRRFHRLRTFFYSELNILNGTGNGDTVSGTRRCRNAEGLAATTHAGGGGGSDALHAATATTIFIGGNARTAVGGSATTCLIRARTQRSSTSIPESTRPESIWWTWRRGTTRSFSTIRRAPARKASSAIRSSPTRRSLALRLCRSPEAISTTRSRARRATTVCSGGGVRRT